MGKAGLQAVITMRLQMTDGLRAAAAGWGMSEEEYFTAYVAMVCDGRMKPVEGSLVRSPATGVLMSDE